MTKGGRFWLACLLGATVALGACWAWLEPSSHEPAVPAGSHRAAPAPTLEQEDALGSQRQQPVTEEGDANQARRPHPITPTHEAMAERREVIGALAEALAEERYEQARALLGEADELSRASAQSSSFAGAVRGYQLILDCLAARAASPDGPRELPQHLLEGSRKYLDQHRLPPRREVRRVCLEGRPFSRRG